MPTALLIIDVQQVLCSGKSAAFEVERVIDRINLVAGRARAAGALVIVIQHETEGTGEMDYGSSPWKLVPGLRTESGDVYLSKKATDSFHQTQLQAILQSRRIDGLIICGLQSEFCVDTTTR
jgi:nicotinamidase-related amidase